MYVKNSAISPPKKEEKQIPGRPLPVLLAGNIHYEVSQKVQGICWGGLGVIQQLVKRLDLAGSIDRRLQVFKRHLPYHESDHVLSLIYNVMSGGHCLQDGEPKRQDPAYRRAVGAERLPAPSTAGDFLRRLSSEDVEQLQESFHEARLKVWAAQKKRWREMARIDVDGTIAPTSGECKQGKDRSPGREKRLFALESSMPWKGADLKEKRRFSLPGEAQFHILKLLPSCLRDLHALCGESPLGGERLTLRRSATSFL